MRVFAPLLPWFFVTIAPSVVATGHFTKPNEQNGTITFQLGEQVEVEWDKTADYSILSLGYYSYTNQTITWLISNSPNYPTTYTWTVHAIRDGFTDAKDDEFWLYIVNGTNFGAPFQSPGFFIQSKSAATQTTKSATTISSTPNPTGAAATGTNTVGEGNSTSSDSSSDSASTGTSSTAGNNDNTSNQGELSTGARAGIGAGIAPPLRYWLSPLRFFSS
ncbi:uncharacterized protein BCR38DRAFT_114536 [Pseudomassariella vexata]|uniref:Ser-Thr-rich glycosyl-phosphatidyl-inositol-anchored membrane family-domain-containing protein n=1 Tax=Pseudomassariella vexata TaxID=1141098 RepID=A0A1Y2DBE9_9PEZI|nr:uncharacterized protein BCR38DRAFT_114536 [Pseudomassariella vexata]ORY56589.1 hypothetical protein BCR38DRAFT_114536 [Pseudomassariella vexata]